MSTAQPVVLVCTVGGSPEPLRACICHYKPSHVIYLASPETRGLIRTQIEEGLEWKAPDTEACTLKNYQNLLQCVQDMRKEIGQALEKMSLPEDTPLIADITGGTKIMSAALALVMMEYRSRFSYVGGTTRTKGGVGVVEQGCESVKHEDNPWDVLALREVRALARAFNHAQFADALNIARGLANNMDEGSGAQKFYAAIADMVQGYMLWDSFDHASALAKLRQAQSRLVPFSDDGRVARLLRGLERDVARVERLQQDVAELRGKGALRRDAAPSREEPAQPEALPGRAYLLDLLGNAQRCAQAGHYDDAVARLYSAIEKCAKVALWTRHGIDNGQVPLDRVPESIREEWLPLADAEGNARVGLERSYQLLAALDDPLGMAFQQRARELKKTLEARNQSLLAHGYVPIGKEKYEKLLAAALEFLSTDAASLPAFPEIDWKALMR